MNHVIDSQTRSKWFFEIIKFARTDDNDITAEKIVKSAALARKYVPNLSIVKDELNFGNGYFLIKGCPVGNKEILNYGNGKSQMNQHNCFVSQLVLLGITQAIGYKPFSYKQEKGGSLVHEIIPEASKQYTISSSGKVEFKPHADGAYLTRDIRPHSLSLMCLNNDSDTSTRIISINELMKKIPKNDIEILSSNAFEHSPPESFDCDRKNNISSILDKLDGNWELKIATHSAKSSDKESESALARLLEAIEQSGVLVCWKPGDLLIFNNLRCLHGRGEVHGKRWLQRCYGSRTHALGSVIDLNGIAV